MHTAHLFRKIFSSRNKIFNKCFCRKRTKHYSFRKSHQRIYKQHYFVRGKEKIDTIKNDKIVKVPFIPKLGPKLKKELWIYKEYMNNITSIKEKENTDIIKYDKIEKLLWIPKFEPKLRKELKKNWHKNHFYFGM